MQENKEPERPKSHPAVWTMWSYYEKFCHGHVSTIFIINKPLKNQDSVDWFNNLFFSIFNISNKYVYSMNMYMKLLNKRLKLRARANERKKMKKRASKQLYYDTINIW